MSDVTRILSQIETGDPSAAGAARPSGPTSVPPDTVVLLEASA